MLRVMQFYKALPFYSGFSHSGKLESATRFDHEYSSAVKIVAVEPLSKRIFPNER
jgi:hypothetical protein